MRHSVWRGLKKWKKESVFQLVPVLFGGGADLMQMAPSAAAGVALDFLTPERLRRTEEEVPSPPQSDSAFTGLTVGDLSDPLDVLDPAVESRIFYVNGDLDMIIEVRNYNRGVSIKDMPSKEFLQLLTSAVDVSGVEEGRTTLESCTEVF